MRHRPLLPIGLPQLAALTLVLGLGLAPRAEASESAAATAAIAKLLSLPAPGSEAAAAAPDGAKRTVVQSLRGENLDRIARRALPKHPFKDEWVRQAFVQLNPEALAKNPMRVLPTGTALFVPTPQDLMAALSEQYGWGPSGSSAHEAPSAAAAVAAKRRWVQFP